MATKARLDLNRVLILGLGGPAILLGTDKARELRDLLNLAIDACRYAGSVEAEIKIDEESA